MKNLLIILAVTLFGINTVSAQESWVGTWATATEQIGPNDMPKESLSNRSLRQIIHVSLGGEQLRLKLSNQFSREAMDIVSVYIADAGEGWQIDKKTATYLKFSGKKNVTIEGGQTVWSDVVNYPLKPLQRLSITINYGERTGKTVTSHRGSRTTSYIIKGVSKPTEDFVGGKQKRVAEEVDHWYTIASLDVLTPEKKSCVVALGNSITDGNGTTTNMQNRWTDFLAEQLDGNVGVLNLGIGGTNMTMSTWQNCGRVRFDRDVLEQTGVTDLIVFYGVNDIGGSKGKYEVVCDSLIHTMQSFIAKAHNKGIRIYLATITPFGRSFYASHFHEAMRQTVNDWIRQCKNCDGIIDFDKAVRDPAHPDCLQEKYSKDWLHLNPTGYELLGKVAAEKLNIEN